MKAEINNSAEVSVSKKWSKQRKKGCDKNLPFSIKKKVSLLKVSKHARTEKISQISRLRSIICFIQKTLAVTIIRSRYYGTQFVAPWCSG